MVANKYIEEISNNLSEYNDVLTIGHLEEILQLKDTQVRYLLKTGKIKSRNICGKKLVLKVDLFHYINEKSRMKG